MAISSLFNKLMGRGVLGNVGDTVVSMGKDAQEVYAQHTNAVGQNVFGGSLASGTAQDTLMKQLSGEIALAKDETKETVLEAATKAGTVNESQKSALDYFMVQNEGKAYTPESINKTFAARDESVADKFQTKSATFLETPTSMPGMSKIGDNGPNNEYALKNDLITLGAGAAVGGIVGSAMYDNAEGGMVAGLAGAGLGRGIARAVNKNVDSISAYGMKTVLGDELVKEGDKAAYSIDTAKMAKLGFDTKDLKVDEITGKVTRSGKDVDLATEAKSTENNIMTHLSMEDIGLGAKVADKDERLQTFTNRMINAEANSLSTLTTEAENKLWMGFNPKQALANDIDVSLSGNYSISGKKGQTIDIQKQLMSQRNQKLIDEKKAIETNNNLSPSEKEINLFNNEIKSKALLDNGSVNTNLLEEQAKAAHATIFKPQKNVGVNADQAQAMNLNNLKSKKESDLGAVQNIAKNMLTTPGGAGKLTGQYRNMILGGAALSGVAFTSNKRDYRRGINANKGNRI